MFLPINGAGKKGVVTIRGLKDVKEIETMLPSVKHVVVIGGGVLGLEAAWELKKSKCDVTVLEAAPMLMGRQLDEPAAELLKKIAKEQGIDIHTGVQVVEFTGEDQVSSVLLADGREFPAELVIVSAGVRANAAVLEKSGVKTEKAVVVNERMETSAADIYACGDCAEFEGINYAIWPEASEQGRIAGANAAGDELVYQEVSSGLSFHGMKTALFAAGDNGKNPNLIYKTVEFKDMGKKHYQKLYFLNNRLCGVILIGDVSRMAELTEALEKRASYKEVL